MMVKGYLKGRRFFTVLLVVGLALALSGCDNVFGSDDEDKSDGILTVTADNKMDESVVMDGVFIVIPSGQDFSFANAVAGRVRSLEPGMNTITAHTATWDQEDSTLRISGDVWQGTGGQRYDVYIWIGS